MSLPVRGAWIEITRRSYKGYTAESLPVRGAWIEIIISERTARRANVAPRAGSVD